MKTRNRKAKIAVIVGLLLLGSIAFAIYFAAAKREPVYQGRPLSSWVQEIRKYELVTNSPPAIAVRSMGPSAIPFLLEIISFEDSPLRKRLRRWADKTHFPVSFAGPNDMDQVFAAYALNVLDSAGEPAFTQLTNLFFTRHTVTASIALAGMGRKGIGTLISGLSNPDYRFQHSAASALAYTRTEGDIVVSALVQCVATNRRAIVSHAAASSLGQLHQNPGVAIPALIEASASADPDLRASVFIALGEFGPTAKSAIPALLIGESDKIEYCQRLARVALEKITGTNAAEK